jgi:hypothetical protein
VRPSRAPSVPTPADDPAAVPGAAGGRRCRSVGCRRGYLSPWQPSARRALYGPRRAATMPSPCPRPSSLSSPTDTSRPASRPGPTRCRPGPTGSTRSSTTAITALAGPLSVLASRRNRQQIHFHAPSRTNRAIGVELNSLNHPSQTSDTPGNVQRVQGDRRFLTKRNSAAFHIDHIVITEIANVHVQRPQLMEQ